MKRSAVELPGLVISIMEILDFRTQYETMTDDQLLNLAIDSSELSPVAREWFEGELSKRRIGRREIEEYRRERASYSESQSREHAEKIGYGRSSFRRFRETLDDWKKYRRQTGQWPRRSIAFYFLHLLFAATALLLIAWYGVQRGWSKGFFMLIVVPLLLVDVLIESWIEGKIRRSEIVRHRIKRGAGGA
jgi:hypothetical protein